MKKPYRFGIDIDGTVTCPSSLIPHINESFQCNLTLDDIKEYDLTAAFPVDRDVFYKWFRESEAHIYATSPIRPDAQMILTEWQKNIELFYISARGENVRDVTIDWFVNHNVPYNHIELVGQHDKIKTARELQVQAFFEDKHDNAVMINEELQIPVLLFNTPYNQEPVPNGVIRVNDWTEANNWLKKEFTIL